jgi:hypothetical protein
MTRSIPIQAKSPASHERLTSGQPAPTLPTAQKKEADPLTGLLANRRWWRRTQPFVHIVAEDVFVPDFAGELARSFQQLLEAPERLFTRNMPGYDAIGLTLTPDRCGAFGLFLSRPWHDMIARVAGVEVTNDIIASLHHHAPGGASGRIHNDLNVGFFVDQHQPGGVNVSNSKTCDYQYGHVFQPGKQARKTVRAVAVLYYINNPLWSPGDGGETGIYSRIDDAVDRPAAAIAPHSNSILIFECTPYSYHSFLANRRTARNSLTMWLHRPWEAAVGCFGEMSILHW